MTRPAVHRILAMLFVAMFALGASSARAIDNAVLIALYGDGMKSFYSGDYKQAHETLTQAIEAGSNDPRCYYFRGLSNARLGRAPDAKLDFMKGAELEALDFDLFFNVSGALQRVQGAERLALEKYRTEGRKLALKEIERIRFLHYQRVADAQAAVEGPATTGAGAPTGAAPAATPAAPAGAPADNPFGAPPAANPFGAPAAPAPAPPAPAANPFGNN